MYACSYFNLFKSNSVNANIVHEYKKQKQIHIEEKEIVVFICDTLQIKNSRLGIFSQ